MNENNQASVPPPSPSPPPFSWWLRKLFASNPFYPASAALLLFGCYRISLDAPLLSGESDRLLFNFSSVQTYEVLLVLVAMFLFCSSICSVALLTTFVKFLTNCSLLVKFYFEKLRALRYIFRASSN